MRLGRVTVHIAGAFCPEEATGPAPARPRPLSMAAPSCNAQQHLQAAWLAARPGCLCAWEQAKALAFREASRELHNGKVKLAWVASKVTKQGGGHPQKGSLSEFFSNVDTDPAWFPGKQSGAKRGRPPVLTTAKRRCIAQSLMRAKARGEEPCPAVASHRCPHMDLEPGDGRAILRQDLAEAYD